MQRVDWQRQLDRMIAMWQAEGRVPRLLLHSCCAPCSSYVLEYLAQYCRITVYYYNPNITQQDEYRHRVEELKRLISLTPARYPIELIEGEYEPKRFLDAVRGLEHEPEGGARCEVCFRLRLQEAARLAEELGVDYYTTSLTISPLKNAQLLNEIGAEMSAKWLPSDFKKKGGYLRSIELSRAYDLYRQNYCGCVFSKRESKIIDHP